MNRLRLLKQRIRNAGDVGVHKMNGGFVVATGRFSGDCTMPMSKRAAIQMAARWAMPNRPPVWAVEKNGIVTKIKTNSRGESVITTTHTVSVERQIPFCHR
jgi:hypothetical protein